MAMTVPLWKRWQELGFRSRDDMLHRLSPLSSADRQDLLLAWQRDAISAPAGAALRLDRLLSAAGLAGSSRPKMTVYASRTGTGEALEAFREWGWNLLVSARGVLRHEGFPYALDNGAWTAHTQGQDFDVPAFDRALDLLGQGAHWVILPDRVGDARRTLEMASYWFGRVRTPKLLAVQDGMTRSMVEDWISAEGAEDLRGIFVGGTDGWKEKTAASWAAFSRENGQICHVGRVNTRRRLAIAVDAGADSVDGSGISQFLVHGRSFHRWTVELGVAKGC